MTLETLQRIYDVIFASYSDVTMIWHGGEPLIMGEAFFRDAIEMQKSYPGVHIVNRMQSNVTLMTETLAQFFFDMNPNHLRLINLLSNIYLLIFLLFFFAALLTSLI